MAGKFSLVTASSDHTARLWVKEKCVKILQGQLITSCIVLPVFLLPFRPYYWHFGCFTDFQTAMYILCTGLNKCIVLLTEHEGVVWSVAVLTERACTFTASEDKTVRMWKAGKCERVFQGKHVIFYYIIFCFGAL